MTPQCACNNGFIMNWNEEADLMENRNSVDEERGPLSTERGVLYLWQSGSSSDGPLIDRVLLSRPVLQAALGANHGLILTQGGVVYTFGELTWRRGLVVSSSSPLMESSLCGQTVVRVAAGGFHCAALTEQGAVYMWGENAAGQCGLTGRGDGVPPQEHTVRGPLFVAEASLVSMVDSDMVPPLGVRVVDVSCGREHTLALSAQQEVWSWGSGCQLGLVTKTFPVWKPRKVEHLAGRHVIQVACGDFHSLALVRSLPPQNHNPHNASEQRSAPLATSEQRSTPLAARRKELVAVDDGHYCPLGVELVETTPLKGSSQKSSPRTKLWTRGRSATSSPDSSRTQTPNHGANTTINTTPSSSTEPNPPMAAQLGPDAQADSSPMARPPAGWRANKSSSFPDEVELKDFFHRLSIRSQDAEDVNHTGGAGDSTSLTSHTSEDSQSSLAEGSSYEDECPVIRHAHLCGLASSAPACVEEVRVSLEEQGEEEEEVVMRKKATTSCLMDLSYEERTGGHRTHSLPGLWRHGGSPLRRRPPAARAGPGAELPSLDTEVWSWGRGLEGQLGHADHLPRLQPLCIDSLTGEEVVKITAGSHHSMALTARCQVFSWGSNISGQLGHLNSPVTVPHQIKLSEGLHAWDVSAGHAHSLLLVDADCVQPIIYYCGQTQGSGQAECQRSPQGQTSPYKAATYTVGPRPLPVCMEMGYISSVSSGGQCCASLADQNRNGLIGTLHELVSRERRHYCLLITVHTTILKPLLERDSVCRGLAEPCGRLFSCLTDSFVRLSVLTGRNSAFLTSFLRDSQRRDVTSFPLLEHASLFLDAYKEYSTSVGNFQVMGGFQTLHKLSVDVIGQQVRQLCVEEKSSSSGDVALMSLFYQPIRHLQQYARLLLKLAHSYDVSTPEYRSLHQGSCEYECLSVSLSKRRREAEATQLFWKTSSGKSTDCLREPERRLVADSRNGRCLTLLHAGRFSVNSFLLFNDVLVHAQYSSHHIYSLTTLWVKAVSEDDTALNALKVTLPEETFTLVASTPQEKNKWLHALSQALEQALGVIGQGSSGVAAACRSASYTFRGDGKLKDAAYTGGWMSGRMHGRGTLKWPDGRSYNGHFKHGLEDGYGEGSLGQTEHYVGHWKEGKIHGFGRYRYANGEVYEGCFNEGHRHGYGMLSSGRLAKTSSCVFIGQWVHDRKTGYGVYDDITKGERYMGLWCDDQRQGSGVVLTQFGLYFEGTFRDNKMTGAGLLVCDDDTVFQGEFCDDWTINGKGVLSLPNADSVDGVFSGEWFTGLKVTGTFTKINLHDVDKKPRNLLKEVGGSAVRADQKWRCVFEECWRRLGCGPTGDLNTAWSNIAVTITTARRESPQLSRSQIRVLEQLEFIPQHEEAVTAANYDTIPRYLAKACETPLHPLGWLVETLVTSYRMTYVGVGSNRRLLTQAVQEFQSYMTRLFNVVRFLFPGLPDEGFIISDGPPSPSTDVNENIQQGCVVVSSSSLLHQVVLSRLYSPLFTLYCLEEERGEAAYWHTVMSLNKQPDQSLFSFLQVHQKFWPVSMSVLGEKKQIVSSSKDVCYVSAVESLQQISTTFTPSDKLLVIQRSFEELTQEVQALLSHDFLWSMDDLFPLFLYVVLRARIRNLGAEVSLIDDLMDPSLQHGELGHMFTTLKACYYQIQQEKA